MALGVRLSAGAVGWCALALGALLAPALATWQADIPASRLDWRPALGWSQPWRLWSAAWVHLNDMHLAVNAVGALVVAALGIAARLSLQATLAWALAWPLTHALLALQPSITGYAGLSGVLHAGVAVAAVWLIRGETGRPRRIGIALLLGLAAKIVVEAPWRNPLPFSEALGIAIVPFAHMAGAIAGTLAALPWTTRR